MTDNKNIKCPTCNSDNVQSEGILHLCLDCGYKWEDAPKTDLGEIIIFQSDEGVKLDVRLENQTVWLNIEQIAQLFNKGRSTINEHILNIFKEGELDEKVVCRKFRHTTQHGALEGKTQSKEVKYYNLDVIISVGYRVKSIQGTRFRQWATERLHEYIVKGFTMDDERLKGLGGGNYWKELLDRIRDIRSSEKVMYRQVLDIYATSVDYDPRTDASRLFFRIVQNKLHYAAHGHTAAEVIYERADADQPFMGLTTFEGELPAIKDIKIAKNYLKENEIRILNNLVSGYFDFAEIMAIEHRPVYMMDYVKQLDTILQSTGRPMLKGSGSISHQKAMDKALEEYRKYQVKALAPVEEAYLESINALGKLVKRKGRQHGDNRLNEE
ncbi:MAG: virulence RhuM family protein [Prevotella sp.]|nr:virulence RhuM family protein [Prevotella sp.]